jgi:hypothetical protein
MIAIHVVGVIFALQTGVLIDAVQAIHSTGITVAELTVFGEMVRTCVAVVCFWGTELAIFEISFSLIAEVYNRWVYNYNILKDIISKKVLWELREGEC